MIRICWFQIKTNCPVHLYMIIFQLILEPMQNTWKCGLKFPWAIRLRNKFFFYLEVSVVSDLKLMANSGMIFIHPKVQNEKVLYVERQTEAPILTGWFAKIMVADWKLSDFLVARSSPIRNALAGRVQLRWSKVHHKCNLSYQYHFHVYDA